MNKLTEIINLRAKIVGTILLSTISVMLSFPAHAFFTFEFGGFSEDGGNSEVNFSFNLDEADQFTPGLYEDAVSDFIQDTFRFNNSDPVEQRVIVSSQPNQTFDLRIGNCCNNPNPLTTGGSGIRSAIAEENEYPDPSPGDMNNNFFDNENSANFLQYSIILNDASTKLIGVNDDIDINNVDFLPPFPGFNEVDGIFSFVVPRSLGLTGLIKENKDTIGTYNYTTSGFQNELDLSEVVVLDGSSTTVTEPSTLGSLLILGSLGAKMFWKRRVKNI